MVDDTLVSWELLKRFARFMHLSFDGTFDILEESDLLFPCASLSLFESLEACCVWDMGYTMQFLGHYPALLGTML